MASFLEFLNMYFLLACAGALFWYYTKSTFGYWQKLKIKFVKPTPLFGNIASFMLKQKSLQQSIDDIYRELYDEPYGGTFLMRDPQLMVKDPALVHAILVKDFKHFQNRVSDSFMVDDNKSLNPISGHLVQTNDERWRILRQKMSPLFSSGQLKHMYDQICYCVDLLTQYIDKRMDGTSVDLAIKPEVEKFTIDVIGTCAFGIECDSLKSNDEFTHMCRESINFSITSVIRLILATINRRLPSLLKIPTMPKKVTDFFQNLALDTVEYRRQNGVVRKDILQLLMNLQNSHIDPKYAVKDSNSKILATEEFDELDVAANAFLFFIAGYETTATTMSFCLYELALNQDIQDKLRSEVQRTQNKCGTIDYDSLKEMTYLDAIIAETGRKYPPVTMLNRVCNEDYVIPDTKVQLPAGTNVLIPVWSIHHDWRNYPNPEVFDPERFIGENKQSLPNGVHVPFGNGPRFCLGKRFAEVELKAALSALVLKYEMKPCAKTDIPLRFKKGSPFLQAENGIWINLSKRKF